MFPFQKNPQYFLYGPVSSFFISLVEAWGAYFSGKIPTKEEDDEFTYEFQGWDKEDELLAVSSDITTRAVYKATAKENWGPIIWF